MTVNPPANNIGSHESYSFRAGENTADEDAITTRLVAFNPVHMPQSAPNFYTALGFTTYGKLEDCPAGEPVFYLRKDL